MTNFLNGVCFGFGVMIIAFYFDPKAPGTLGLILGIANIVLGSLDSIRDIIEEWKILTVK